MRSIEDAVAAAPRPGSADPGQPPDAVRITVPAHLSSVATIRAAVRAIDEETRGADGDRDLQLAADEASAVLIEDARPWSVVHLSIAYDDTDIYVRIAARRAHPERRLVIQEWTHLLLDSVVESYEVFSDDGWGYAILQTARGAA